MRMHCCLVIITILINLSRYNSSCPDDVVPSFVFRSLLVLRTIKNFVLSRLGMPEDLPRRVMIVLIAMSMVLILILNNNAFAQNNSISKLVITEDKVAAMLLNSRLVSTNLFNKCHPNTPWEVIGATYAIYHLICHQT